VIQALHKHKDFQKLIKGVNPFLIYRADTNVVPARGALMNKYEEAKTKANELRKKHNLRWNQVKFRAEKSRTPHTPLDVVEGWTMPGSLYPSKGRWFRRRYSADGNFHDTD